MSILFAILFFIHMQLVANCLGFRIIFVLFLSTKLDRIFFKVLKNILNVQNQKEVLDKFKIVDNNLIKQNQMHFHYEL